jgi:hypothetical protein
MMMNRGLKEYCEGCEGDNQKSNKNGPLRNTIQKLKNRRLRYLDAK